MQSVEEYNEVNKRIEVLRAEIKSLSAALKHVEPVYKMLCQKRSAANKYMPYSEHQEVKEYEDMAKTLPEKKKALDELRKQEQKRTYDWQSEEMDAYEKGEQSVITPEHYTTFLAYHKELEQLISEGRVHESVDQKHNVFEAKTAIERLEKKLEEKYERYKTLKEKEKTQERMFSEEDKSKLHMYEQKESELKSKTERLENIQRRQRSQDRRDIQEFFGIHAPLEHKGNGMQVEHDEKTGYDYPILVRQTTGDLGMTARKLKSILDKKLESGEIDEATYEMMDDKVSFEYARMRQERREEDTKRNNKTDMPSGRD